jgi:tetratricopeptide (TPR) repeat protein
MNQPFPESQSSSYLYPLSKLPELSPTQQISAEYFLSLGNRHYNNYLSRAQKRDLDLAITHYKEALDMNPAIAEVHVKLASALWDRGMIPLETAIEFCDNGLRLNPDYSDAHLFKGYFLRRAGQLEEAVNQFQLAIQKIGRRRQSSKARLALGRALLQRANRADGLPALGRMLMGIRGLKELTVGCCLLPLDRPTFSVLQGAFFTDMQVISLVGMGRFAKSFGLCGVTGSIYEWAGNHMPQEAIFFHLLGDLHVEKDNLDAAIHYYDRARELEPENPVLHKKLGHVYNECKDTVNAAKSLEKVVAAEAADFDTYYALAQIYSDQANYMRALYYFKELLVQSPDNPYLHSNIAYILFKMEDYDGAIQEYQNAVKFGKDPIWTATVAQTLGTIYYQVKQDLEAAARIFRMACQLDPSDLECLSMLGDIYTEQGNFEAAIETYRYIISVEPDNAECYNYLGYLLWQLDKNDEAIESYNKAIELNGDNPIAYNNLGVIYLDEKCQLELALDMFQRALFQKPDYTLACFNVARSLEAMGRTAEAAKGYSHALTLNAHNPELSNEEISERLEHLFQV